MAGGGYDPPQTSGKTVIAGPDTFSHNILFPKHVFLRMKQTPTMMMPLYRLSLLVLFAFSLITCGGQSADTPAPSSNDPEPSISPPESQAPSQPQWSPPQLLGRETFPAQSAVSVTRFNLVLNSEGDEFLAWRLQHSHNGATEILNRFIFHPRHSDSWLSANPLPEGQRADGGWPVVITDTGSPRLFALWERLEEQRNSNPIFLNAYLPPAGWASHLVIGGGFFADVNSAASGDLNIFWLEDIGMGRTQINARKYRLGSGFGPPSPLIRIQPTPSEPFALFPVSELQSHALSPNRSLVVWHEHDTSGVTLAYALFNADTGWTLPRFVPLPRGATERGRFRLTANGSLSAGAQLIYWYASNPAALFSTHFIDGMWTDFVPIIPPDDTARLTDVTTMENVSGEVFLIWREERPATAQLLTSRFHPVEGWRPPQPLSTALPLNDANTTRQPVPVLGNTAINNEGYGAAIWLDAADQILFRTYEPDVGWHETQMLTLTETESETPLGARIAVTTDRSLIVLWITQQQDPLTDEITLRTYRSEKARP